uniref:Otopetrin-2 n=1 Tax=Macrostomum lignano TaxID=282301 RepID=A0A1I8IU84_9PLAT
MGLTLFGFVFPLSNYVSLEPFSAWYLAGFYIILYLVSIAFLVFFLAWVLRRPPHILFLSDSERRRYQQELDQNQLHHNHHRPGPVTFHVGMNGSMDSDEEDSGNDNKAFEANKETTKESAAAPNLPPAPAFGEACIELHEPGVSESPELPDRIDSISNGSSNRSSTVFDQQTTVNSAYSDATTAFSVATAAAAARRRRNGAAGGAGHGGGSGRRMGDRINSTLLQNAREFGVQEIPACSVLSLQESHSPSFFLRVACFIFGALKMTHETLMIVDCMADITGHCAYKKVSDSVAKVLQYTLSIIFTVLQTFFLFKYSKVSVNIYRNFSVLGFMHLLATNMCVWFQAILLETSHSTKNHSGGNDHGDGDHGSSSYSSNDTYSNASTTAHSVGSTCSKDVFWRMAPYLFPFTIEYALMAAFTCFTLYRNVSKFLDVIQSKGFNVAKKCLRNRKRSQTSFSASCYKTDKGFFLGAFLLILGIVSGIYFTVYVNDKPDDAVTSQLIYQITDLILLTVNLVLCAIANAKMRKLTLLHRAGTGPDSWLLGITLIGVLAYQMFQLFGASAEQGVFMALRIIEGLLSIGQSVFQVYLVLDGEKRRSKSDEVIEEKPGREMIAALLLGNIAQWIVYTLEIREINNLPNYSHAYVPVASNIFAYVCSPLIIFFRFHSACCFVEIWRTAYKGRKRRCQSHPDLTVCSTVPGSVSALQDSSTKSNSQA